MIVEGMVYLDSCNLVHFDLKLDNILVNLDQENNVTNLCITDFGLTQSNRQNSTNEKGAGASGTLSYMAPEMLVPDSSYDKAIDAWSLGINLYALLFNVMPFFGDNNNEL